jgi:hypothetical protein
MFDRTGNDPDAVREALARAVATRDVSDSVIQTTAERLAEQNFPIFRIDVCAYGICTDYVIDGPNFGVIEELVNVDGGIIRDIDIFPFGIVRPDGLHVRVTHDFKDMPRD